MAGAQGVRAGRAFVEIGADPRRLFAAIKGLQREFRKIGQAATQLGARISAIGASFSVPIGLAVRQFASFDDAIRATSAVSGATGNALEMLSDTARELGRTTSFTAVQVANLMTELGRAGFSPRQINEMTGAVLNLARATGTDASMAAGIMAATLRQFALEAGDAARVSNVLTKAANATFNTVEGLGESLKYAGPVAKDLGMSLEDTVAVLGVLGNVGIQGSNAGTALRRLSVIAAASGDQLQELFGVSNTDAAGNLRPLVDILDDINTATANMPVAERTARMSKAFGLLGITSANVLSNTAGGVRGLAKELQNADGVAAATAQQMDAGLGGAFRIALSAIEGVGLALAESLAPGLQSITQIVTGVAGGLTRLIEANQGLVAKVGAGLAAFTAFGVVLTGVGVSLQVAAFGMGGVAKALDLVIGPIKAVATAAYAIVVGFAKATIAAVAYAAQSIAAATATAAAWAVANAPLIAIGAAIAAAAALAVQAAGGFAKLGQQMQSAFSGLGEMASGAGNAVSQAFGTMLADARQVFGDLYDISATTFGGISDALAVGDLAGAAEVAWLGLQAVWQRGIAAIMSYTDPFAEYLQNVWGDISTFTINAVDGLFSFLQQGFRTGFAVVQGIVDNVVNGLLNTFDNLVTNIRVAWTRVQGFITGAEDTQERVDKIRDEQQARQEQRRQERPGVAGRLEAAGQANAQDQRNVMARQDARIAANEQAQDDRAARTAQRAEERQAGIADTTGQLDATRQRLAANRQGVDLLPSIAQAGTLEELQQLAAQIKQLEAAGASADVIERLTDQIDDRAIELDKQRADQARAGSNQAANAQQADTRPGPSQTDVVGTFSAAALGQMGFGSNLAQQQLDVQKKIEENTRQNNVGTVVE